MDPEGRNILTLRGETSSIDSRPTPRHRPHIPAKLTSNEGRSETSLKHLRSSQEQTTWGHWKSRAGWAMDLSPPFDQMSWESYESTSGGRRRDLGKQLVDKRPTNGGSGAASVARVTFLSKSVTL
jgi:hypothetical protein